MVGLGIGETRGDVGHDVVDSEPSATADGAQPMHRIVERDWDRSRNRSEQGRALIQSEIIEIGFSAYHRVAELPAVVRLYRFPAIIFHNRKFVAALVAVLLSYDSTIRLRDGSGQKFRPHRIGTHKWRGLNVAEHDHENAGLRRGVEEHHERVGG